MHAKVRRERIPGRGPVGKTAVVGVKDRATNKVAAEVVDSVAAATLVGFVDAHAADDAMVYTGGATAYRGRKNHEAVHHSVGEHERGKAHTNGVELFRGMLKRCPSRHVPSAVREASAPVCGRVLRPSQHPRPGHRRAEGAHRGSDGRTAAYLRRADRWTGRRGAGAVASLAGRRLEPAIEEQHFVVVQPGGQDGIPAARVRHQYQR